MDQIIRTRSHRYPRAVAKGLRLFAARLPRPFVLLSIALSRRIKAVTNSYQAYLRNPATPDPDRSGPSAGGRCGRPVEDGWWPLAFATHLLNRRALNDTRESVFTLPFCRPVTIFTSS